MKVTRRRPQVPETPPPAQTGEAAAVRRARYCTYLAFSYALEWLFFLAVIIVPLYVAVYYIPFRVRTVSLTDSTLAQPYVAKDSLPILFVFETSVLVPLVFFHLYPFLLSKFYWKVGLPKHEYSFKYSYWWSVCIIHTVGLTVLLSELSKRLVQAPRPDFMSRCFPLGVPDEVREQAAHSFSMFHTDLCTPETREHLEDGMQSFPSEHTSLAWCMCSVLILFFITIREELLMYSAPITHAVIHRATGGVASIQQTSSTPGAISAPAVAPKLQPNMIAGPHTTDSDHPLVPAHSELHATSAPTAPSIVASGLESHSAALHAASASFWPTSHVLFIAHVILPFGWAVAVGFSRTFDHRHHVQDVMAGALLGVGVAYAVYKVHLAKFTGYHQRWKAADGKLATQ